MYIEEHFFVYNCLDLCYNSNIVRQTELDGFFKEGLDIMDSQTIFALLLALIAGLSTLVGAAVVTISGSTSRRLLAGALGLAAGVMISACFLDLFPEAQEYFHHAVENEHSAVLYSVLFMLVGIIIAALSEKLIPHACGHNHAHDHTHHHHKGDECEEECEDDVRRVGIVSMLSISLHNFPEGIALFVAGYEDTTLGIALALAVVLHNIPGGIAIAAPVYYSTRSRAKSLVYALVPSLIQPLGALLAALVLKQVMNEFIMGAMFALVAGFMLFMALTELLPSSRNYGHTTLSTAMLFVGILLMPLTHMLAPHAH